MVRVILADARQGFTVAVEHLLRNAPGINVVGVVSSCREAERLAEDERPDLIVAGADLPGGGGLHLATALGSSTGGPAVVLLASEEDDDLLLRCLDAGALGVVVRERAFDDLVHAIIAAPFREPLVPAARLARLLVRHRARRAPTATELTARELDVLRLLAQGLPNELIASKLVVSRNTVRNHVQRILAKLRVHSRLEAVTVAVREGIVAFR